MPDNARRTDISTLSHEDLVGVLEELRQPRYRAGQIEQWVYGKGAGSFDDMSNMPKALREELAARYTLPALRLLDRRISRDGTRKYLFDLHDGASIESVGIPSTSADRLSVCISSQAGCAMGCVFCATGRSGFARNLSAGEMVAQVLRVGRDFDMRVSSVVVMGQGEPFANFDALERALRMLNEPSYANIGARHITVSTCGILDGIERFSKLSEQYTLAVSLHSAIQRTRDQIMPGVRTYPLDALRDALVAYGQRTHRRPSLEYALMDGLNDDQEHLDALVDFCRGMLCHVNLIPLNPIGPATKHDDAICINPSIYTSLFYKTLVECGIEGSVRQSRGADIDGACGQLRQRYADKHAQPDG